MIVKASFLFQFTISFSKVEHNHRARLRRVITDRCKNVFTWHTFAREKCTKFKPYYSELYQIICFLALVRYLIRLETT